MPAYSFLDVQAAVTGPGGIVNLGNGAQVAEEGISYEMLEDKSTLLIGADGSYMQSLHAGHGGSISVRLLKTSPTNFLLSAMYDFQRISSANWGQNVIVIRDPTRGDVITAIGASFRRTPPNTFAKAGNIIEWGFMCGRIEPLLGVGTAAL
jgi:hypothetical protein